VLRSGDPQGSWDIGGATSLSTAGGKLATTSWLLLGPWGLLPKALKVCRLTAVAGMRALGVACCVAPRLVGQMFATQVEMRSALTSFIAAGDAPWDTLLQPAQDAGSATDACVRRLVAHGAKLYGPSSSRRRMERGWVHISAVVDATTCRLHKLEDQAANELERYRVQSRYVCVF